MLIMFIHVRKPKVWRKVSFYVPPFFFFKTTSSKTLSDINEYEKVVLDWNKTAHSPLVKIIFEDRGDRET